MKELKPNPVEGPALSDEVYALALARIDAVMGCTEDSPEEAELVLWAEIADAHERTSGCQRRHCGPRRPPAGG